MSPHPVGGDGRAIDRRVLMSTDAHEATPQVDSTMAARLIRLRSFLHAAQASSSDLTSTGRHAAAVALDGVCELAMGLAAVELELPPPNGIEGLPRLLARLTERLGDRWKHEGVKGFRELHRARNAAQHDGLAPRGSTSQSGQRRLSGSRSR